MDFIKEAISTELKDYTPACERLGSEGIARILHAAMGLCTEASETLDAVKKHVFYGKELDRTNLKEELGDIFWYAAILADELGLSFEDVQKTNIEKLRSRYKKGFSETDANNRDLDKERRILNDPFQIATNNDLKGMHS